MAPNDGSFIGVRGGHIACTSGETEGGVDVAHAVVVMAAIAIHRLFNGFTDHPFSDGLLLHVNLLDRLCNGREGCFTLGLRGHCRRVPLALFDPEPAIEPGSGRDQGSSCDEVGGHISKCGESDSPRSRGKPSIDIDSKRILINNWGMGQIVIKGLTVLFDDIDSDVVERYQWHLHVTPTVNYARGYIKGNRDSGLVYMHRLILGVDRGQDVDHANGSGLDNRRHNLRVCNRTQNNANRHFSASASGIKGVHFETYTGKWRAEIQYLGKRYKLGRFTNKDDAAKAYMDKAMEFFGEFANYVDQSDSSK